MLSKNIQIPKIELVTVTEGEFVMGRLDGFPHGGREDPSHSVTLPEFQIGGSLGFRVANACSVSHLGV